jgi:hypothetical protein
VNVSFGQTTADQVFFQFRFLRNDLGEASPSFIRKYLLSVVQHFRAVHYILPFTDIAALKNRTNCQVVALNQWD